MNLDHKKFNCTGCGGCSNICPTKAISIELDKEGFYHYKIDKEKCIDCGMCVKICPKIEFDNQNSQKNIKAYAAYSKDEKIVLNSSSGGLFSVIAKKILAEGGIVVGVTMDECRAKHILIEKEEDLNKIQGSKYLQSYTGNIYTLIKKEVKQKKVLFSGTPCQCAAVKKIINHDNLITIDIVCHGVPSLNTFKKSLTDRFQENIDNVNFRKKSLSWLNYSIEYLSGNKLVKRNNFRHDEWFIGYLQNRYLMKSCYECGFNKLPRVGDITIGDCWGINILDKEFFDKNNDKGISLLILNNQKGVDLFNSIKKETVNKKININDYKIYNPRIFTGIYDKKFIEYRKKYFISEKNDSFNKKRYCESKMKLLIKSGKNIIKKIIRR